MVGLGHGSRIFGCRGERGAQRPSIGVVRLVLVLAGLGLLLLSRLDHDYAGAARGLVADAMAPVLDIARGPLEPLHSHLHRVRSHFEKVESIEAMKRRNQELEHANEQLKWRARELERQLNDLSELARVVRIPEIPYLSARVIASAPRSLGASVLVGVGRSHKVVAGHAVLGAGGFIGRVVDAFEKSSRVLLITDMKSRIPVHIGTDHVRALMMGDNGPLPVLRYVPENAVVRPGDAVVTSGVGGVLPRGLRIGEVFADGTHLMVRPSANLDVLDYVSVLLYAAPELELSDGPGVRGVGRRAQVRAKGSLEVAP